jgi:monofunctional biosynthetic peptidoglycan transglycosylase
VLYKFVPRSVYSFDGDTGIENSGTRRKLIQSRWEPIENISVLQKAVIASEDGSFLVHNGFDFKAMQKSIQEQ